MTQREMLELRDQEFEAAMIIILKALVEKVNYEQEQVSNISR